jgi:uroporphyrinogen decarboxylase
MMTNRERVLATLRHQQPDKVPYHVTFTHAAHANMARYYGDPDFETKLNNCFLWLETQKPGSWREVRPDIWEDEFGCEWNRSVDKDIGAVQNCLVTPDNVHDFQFPDPRDPVRYAGYARQIQKNPDRIVLADLGFSLFERAWILAGMENVLMEMIGDPQFVHNLLDRILEYNLEIIEHACDQGIDAMRFGDDWGTQMGLIMGLDRWREFIKPRIQQMYNLAKSKGKIVIIHCCGKVEQIFPDLIELGVVLFNPFQPEVMDVYDMKQRFGSQLSFFGGISTQRLLPFGTVAEVRDECRRMLDVVGKNGGYVASPAHDVPPDAKPENVAAMLEVFDAQ